MMPWRGPQPAIDPFIARIAEAEERLPPSVRAAIEAAFVDADIPEGGWKFRLARLMGFKDQASLSRVLSGATRGQRHRAKLAELFAVDLAWLEGDDSVQPDWLRDPAELYQAWSERLLLAIREAVLRHDRRGGPNDHSESGVGSEVATVPVQIEQAWLHVLGHEARPSTVTALLKGRFEEIAFPLLLRFAAHLGVRTTAHLDPLEQGHKAAQAQSGFRDHLAVQLQRRLDRYRLPGRLFQVTRLALVALREQLRYRGREHLDIDDALEILWRHHLDAKHGRKAAQDPVHPQFTAETGREAWTPLRRLHERWPEREDAESPYVTDR